MPAYAIVGAAPEAAWKLKGPMTTMKGILMFGWSTAILFEVLRKALEHLASIGAYGSPSILQIQASELLPIQEHDLALGVADESEDAELMQPR